MFASLGGKKNSGVFIGGGAFIGEFIISAALKKSEPTLLDVL